LIYGLKQSMRASHDNLSVILEEIGFIRSNTDSFLFVHLGHKDTLVVLIYVHDLISI
jgi:hypothetical protein